MKYDVIQAGSLPSDVIAAWEQLRDSNPSLDNPYFSWRFVQCAGSVRVDARVGVVSDGTGIIALFPFQCSRFRAGRPIAGALSDYQGLIVDPRTEIDPAALIRGCGLSAWRFDHLIASQAMFGPHHTALLESPVMDLSAGYDAYVAERKEAGVREIRDLGRKSRKLEREVGPLRFEARSTDRAAMETLRRWKSAQYLACGNPDVFAPAWTRDLLERVWAERHPDFEGILSTLHAGDTLVAAHFGMRSKTVWHWWFPVYSHEHAEYSPGIILLMRMAAVAGSMGISLIDFGKGDSEYKSRLKNRSIAIAEGAVELPSLARSLEQARRWALRVYERGGLGRALKIPLSLVYRYERARRFA